MVKATLPDNRLLGALPRNSRRELSPQLERVELVYKEIIYKAGEKIRDVYFPESGIISLLSIVDAGSSIEVGIVGSEGMVGLPVILGVKRSSTWALVQGAGFAFRMKAVDFTRYAGKNVALSGLALRNMHSLFTQISQSAACN